MIRKVIFYVALLVALLAAQEKKPQVAVMDIVDPTLKASEAIALTERLIYILEQTGEYTLLDRGVISQILQEQGFQQSGCTSGECAVEVGQILGVQKMVSCKIGAVGKYYTISIRLIDVQTGAIDKSAGYDVVGTVEDVLTTGLKQAVKQLISTDGTKSEKKQKETKDLTSENKKVVKSALSIEEKQSKTKRTAIVALGTTAAISTATAGYLWFDMAQSYRKYHAATVQSEMDRLFNKANKTMIMASAATVVAGALIPVTIVIAKKGSKKPVAKVAFAPVFSSETSGIKIHGEF